MSRIEDLTDRVERLLLRHEELQRTNALLQQQVLVVTQERDSLRARLSAARARIDTLIDKLPAPDSEIIVPCAGTAADTATLLKWVETHVPLRGPVAPTPPPLDCDLQSVM